MREGDFYNNALFYAGYDGHYWPNAVQSAIDARFLYFISLGTEAQGNLWFLSPLASSYTQGRDQGLFIAPLYFNRAGGVSSDALNYPGSNGYFWSSIVSSSSLAYYLIFSSANVNPASNYNRYSGRSVRCLGSGEKIRCTGSS